MPVARHDVLLLPLLKDLDHLVRHARLRPEGGLRQVVQFGMEPLVFFNVPLKLRVAETPHHAFL